MTDIGQLGGEQEQTGNTTAGSDRPAKDKTERHQKDFDDSASRASGLTQKSLGSLASANNKDEKRDHIIATATLGDQTLKPHEGHASYGPVSLQKELQRPTKKRPTKVGLFDASVFERLTRSQYSEPKEAASPASSLAYIPKGDEVVGGFAGAGSGTFSEDGNRLVRSSQC